MPVLLISGHDVPVGNMGKDVQTVKKQLDTAGLKRVSMHILPGARRILMNENERGAADKSYGIIAE